VGSQPSKWEIQMYHLNQWRDEIEPMRVVKVTPQFVFFVDVQWGKERITRARKDDFYRTQEEAGAAMLHRAEEDVRRHKEALHRAESKLDQVRAKVRKPA